MNRFFGGKEGSRSADLSEEITPGKTYPKKKFKSRGASKVLPVVWSRGGLSQEQKKRSDENGLGGRRHKKLLLKGLGFRGRVQNLDWRATHKTEGPGESVTSKGLKKAARTVSLNLLSKKHNV